MESEKGFMSVPQSEGKKKGQKICAWCNKYLGEWDREGVSHGMCQKCFNKEMEKEDSSDEKRNEKL